MRALLHKIALGLLPLALLACGGQASFQGADKKADHKSLHSATGDGTGLDANGYPIAHPGEDSTAGDLEPSDDPRNPQGTDGVDPDGEDPDPSEKPDPNGNDPDLIIREMSFPTKKELIGEINHDLDSAYVDQELVLKSMTVDKAKQFTQQPRPAAVDEYEQGRGSEDLTENFEGLTTRPLDILLVIDNGSSMQQEAKNIQAKLEPLLSYIDQTDWQVGVVTTDPAQTCLRALIKKGQTDARTAFLNAVNVGTTGSNNPRGFLQAVRSLSGECLTQKWIRDTSAVEILVVSDSDNCVDGNACLGKDYASTTYLSNYMAQIRTIGKDTHFHAVIMPANVAACDCTTAKSQGVLYNKLVNQTGGGLGNICTQNYEPALRAISGSVTVNMLKVFTLKMAPAAGTLKVYRDGVELTTGFTITGRTLELATALGTGQKLTVVYRNAITVPQTKFALRYAPLAGSVKVTVNGVEAAAKTYTVSANPPSIDFAQAPALGAKISISYTRDVPLQTQFKLEDVVRPGSLQVRLNGVLTNDYSFDAVTTIVTFATAPAEGTLINFAYAAAGAPILAYPFDLGDVAPNGLTVVDALTMVPVGFSYANRTITVTAAEFREGRKLLVRYLNANRGSFSVTLPQDPLSGSVKVIGGGITCDKAPQLVVQGRMVTVDGCGFGPDVKAVTVVYHYIETYREFVFNAPNLPAPNDYQFWTVWVDGMETKDYVRLGNVIKFANDVPGSIVRIQLIQKAP